MLVHLGVPFSRHHLDERLRSRVRDDENRVPPRTLAVTDDYRRCPSRIKEAGTDAFEVRCDLSPVL